MDSQLDPKLVSELLKLTGYLIWICAGAIIAAAGFAIRLTWQISKFHSKVEVMETDLNGFGKRTNKVEVVNASNERRLTIIETKMDIES